MTIPYPDHHDRLTQPSPREIGFQRCEPYHSHSEATALSLGDIMEPAQ